MLTVVRPDLELVDGFSKLIPQPLPTIIYNKLNHSLLNKNKNLIPGGSWTNTPGYNFRRLLCELNIFPYKLNSKYIFNGMFIGPTPTNKYMHTNLLNLNNMVLLDRSLVYVLMEFNFVDGDRLVYINEYNIGADDERH